MQYAGKGDLDRDTRILDKAQQLAGDKTALMSDIAAESVSQTYKGVFRHSLMRHSDVRCLVHLAIALCITTPEDNMPSFVPTDESSCDHRDGRWIRVPSSST